MNVSVNIFGALSLDKGTLRNMVNSVSVITGIVFQIKFIMYSILFIFPTPRCPKCFRHPSLKYNGILPTLLCTIPSLQTENKALYPLDKGENFLHHRRSIANNSKEIRRSMTSTKMN